MTRIIIQCIDRQKKCVKILDRAYNTLSNPNYKSEHVCCHAVDNLLPIVPSLFVYGSVTGIVTVNGFKKILTLFDNVHQALVMLI